MQKNILQIIWLLLLLCFASMVYFLSLMAGAPFAAAVLLTAVFGFVSYRWLGRHIITQEAIPQSKAYIAWSYLILIAGVAIITNKSYYIEQKYGDWDAWWIWNFHARFLQYPQYAGFLLSKHSQLPHPDYPLFVPGSIAFFWRLIGADNILVSYILTFFTTLAIPVVTYLALYRKNIVVAALALLLLATDEFYLGHALAQYADLPLGLMFLCAFICVEQIQEQPLMVVAAAAVLGCCLWIKNEGEMLAAVFIVFNYKSLLAQGHWRYFVSGIAFPLIVLLLFKSTAHANDLIELQGSKTQGYMYDWSRYSMIGHYLLINLNDHFVTVKAGLIAYAIYCLVKMRLPGNGLATLLCCTAGYFFVYVLTPKSLEWHLQTSMDRVLLQIMPAYVYVLARSFSGIHFYREKKAVLSDRTQ